MTDAADVAVATDATLGYFPTPAAVADHFVYLTLDQWMFAPPIRVLEPSAGTGSLARAVRRHLPHAQITCVEPDPARAARLRRAATAGRALADHVVQDTLENFLASAAADGGRDGAFDVIVANPPFALPGRRQAWAEHILAMYDAPGLLAPWGILGAIVPANVKGYTGGPRAKVRRLVEQRGWTSALDRDAFKGVAAVQAACIWIQPPLQPEEEDEAAR